MSKNDNQILCGGTLFSLLLKSGEGLRTAKRNKTRDESDGLSQPELLIYEGVLRHLYDMDAEKTEEYILIPFLTEMFGNFMKHTGYRNYLFSQYPVIYYDYGEPLEESSNQPASPITQFLVFTLDDKYEHSINDLPFHRELAVWVSLFPVWMFAENNDRDGSYIRDVRIIYENEYGDNIGIDVFPEIIPPERVHCSSYNSDDGYDDGADSDTVYDEMGWELVFKPEEIYAKYENESKYEELLKMLESDGFQLKVEYFALYDYYETLKQRYPKAKTDAAEANKL